MQINYRPATLGSGTVYTTFADDLNILSPRTVPDLIDYHPPSFKTLEQVEPIAGASQQFLANRGNGLWTMRIPIRMWFASAMAARQAIPGLAAPWNIGLVDIQVLEVSAADAVYLPAANLGEFIPACLRDHGGQSGIAISFTLHLTGPNFTLTAP